MNSHKRLLAIDLGATSGRLIVCENDELTEIHRFKDYLKNTDSGLIWDLDFIYQNIILGLKKAIEKYGHIDSLSIDSWGVDYVLLNGDQPLKPFYSYRDARTDKTVPLVHNTIPFIELYKMTGIQFVKFNTIYQLKDDYDKGRLDKATDFLHIPEYLSYLLTGKKVKEYTMASTTGLLNLSTGEYDEHILSRLNYPKKLFPKLVKPGYVLGSLKEDIQKEIGGDIKVIMCASHDTASAFEAVDVSDNTVILSSGTWSLIGVKINPGNNSELSYKANFTNEGGVNYIRYLKNIMGMWIFNEVFKKTNYSYDEVNSLVLESHYDGVFDVNDESLLAPIDMREAINKLLISNPPLSDGDLFRSIYRSLAYSYKNSVEELNHNLNKNYDSLCIVGGGAKNKVLNSIIGEITNLKIIAMPIEATAMGNLKIQLKGE